MNVPLVRMFREDRVARWILLAALLVRVAFFVEVRTFDLDLSKRTDLDMIFLQENAVKIAGGDVRLGEPFLGSYRDVPDKLYGSDRYESLFGKSSYVDSPGYLYFAALCETIGPRSPYTAIFCQEILNVVTCALVYAIARRARGVATARLALAASALCLEQVAEAGFVLRESFLGFLATASAYALDEARREGSGRAWVLAGLAWGAGWVSKLSFALALPGVALVAFCATLSSEEEQPRGARAQRAAGDLSKFALGAAIAVAPFAGRNLSLGVPPLRMASFSLANLVARQIPEYRGAGEPAHSNYPQVKAVFDASDGTTLGVLRTTLSCYPSAGAYASQLAGRLGWFCSAVDFWNNVRCSWLELLSPVLGLCVVEWGVLAPWAAIGLASALFFRERRRALLAVVVFFVALGPLTALLGGVYTRYRMVVEPLACVLFATAVVDAARLIVGGWRRRSAKLAAGVAIVAAGIVLHAACHDRWSGVLWPAITKARLREYARSFPSQTAQGYLKKRADASSAPD